MSKPVMITVGSTECRVLLRTPLGDHWLSETEAFALAGMLEVEANKVRVRQRAALRQPPPFAGRQPAAQGGADGGRQEATHG